jgi:hypothetical protein
MAFPRKLLRPPYRIDPSIRSMLPPLTIAERELLKAKVKEEGKCLSPLVVWRQKGILIDGHNRTEIIRELRREGIEIEPPQIVHKSFPDHFAVVKWIIQLIPFGPRLVLLRRDGAGGMGSRSSALIAMSCWPSAADGAQHSRREIRGRGLPLVQ